jgi:hypothetical protein
MKYMLLIYGDPHKWEALTPAENDQVNQEYMTFSQRIAESGEMLGGAPLQGIDTATTVRINGGQRVTTDGPFAETKEVLGGYYLVDVADLDRALALAAEIPSATHELGSIEVRPLQDFPGM